MSIQLDYTLEKTEDRVELVRQILEETPNPNEKYLEILADYIIYCQEKEEKHEKKIMTPNHRVTVDKRETSYEGLVDSLENGEDGIYNLMDTNNKNAIFKPKRVITKKDLEEIPELRQLRDAIGIWQNILKTAEGRNKFIAKKTIIELRKDQYYVLDSIRQPIQTKSYIHSHAEIQFDDTTHEFDKDGYPIPEGISLLNPVVCSTMLCIYPELKMHSEGKFNGDAWYFCLDFENLYEKALKDYPLYRTIVEDKWLGMQNIEIQADILEKYGQTHSIEYISSLWRNKIPKLIASVAEDQFLDYYYMNIEYGKYKRCSKCGQVKLAHAKYFSKNKTSKDGWYSICKCCRNAKEKEKKKAKKQ